ncbi:MAG: hypothetical protein ABIN67_04085 [Ferruginibacter sp.]
MKILYSAAAVLLISIVLTSCAKKLTFARSPVVPAATGKVKYKKDDNNNYNITVDVENLAEAKNLTPPRELYVVWMESDRNRSRNIGQIDISSGLFSNKLKGSLKAVSTSKPSRFFITAEDDGNVQYPGSQRVLTTGP